MKNKAEEKRLEGLKKRMRRRVWLVNFKLVDTPLGDDEFFTLTDVRREVKERMNEIYMTDGGVATKNLKVTMEGK